VNDKDKERLRVLEEVVLGLAERVVALEDGWEVVGEAARRGIKRLEEIRK
jgi:hypothetical protein